jgi:glycosyltransferase 2 family protein
VISRARGLRWALTAGIVVLLVLFGRTIEWRLTWASIRHAAPGLLTIAILLNLVSVLVKGVRWWVFLAPVSSVPVSLVMRATIAGAGLNDLLVANGGDVARGVFVGRAASAPAATVVATLAVERLFDVVCYVLLLAFAGLFLPLPHSLEMWTYPAGFALVALIGFLIFLVRAPARRPEALISAGDVPSPRGLGERVRAQMIDFAATVRLVSSTPRFAAAFALSMISWLTQLYCYHFAARSTGLPISQTGTLACLLAVNLGLIVRATPGNVGFFQFVYALTAASFGVHKAAAVGAAFLIQACQMIPVSLLGMALVPELVFNRRSTTQRAA